MEIGGALPETLTVDRRPREISLLISLISASLPKMKRYGDMGSPYLIPRDGVKLRHWPLLSRIENWTIEKHCLIITVNLSLNPNALSTRIKKFHSKRS